MWRRRVCGAVGLAVEYCCVAQADILLGGALDLVDLEVVEAVLVAQLLEVPSNFFAEGVGGVKGREGICAKRMLLENF